MGDIGHSDAIPDFQFRGSRVVNAFIKSLIEDQYIFGSNDKINILFGGYSAGARGAMAHLDQVANQFKYR
jgi:hypothetical protein